MAIAHVSLKGIAMVIVLVVTISNAKTTSVFAPTSNTAKEHWAIICKRYVLSSSLQVMDNKNVFEDL